jgi:hypothetical protein
MTQPFRLTRPEPLEQQIQRLVLIALCRHPRVAWANRVNSGVFRPQRKDGSTGYVRAGFVGLSDIIGQLKTGEFLACEVKRRDKAPTEPQEAFLERVRASGGVAFIARSIDDVFEALA